MSNEHTCPNQTDSDVPHIDNIQISVIINCKDVNEMHKVIKQIHSRDKHYSDFFLLLPVDMHLGNPKAASIGVNQQV